MFATASWGQPESTVYLLFFFFKLNNFFYVLRTNKLPKENININDAISLPEVVTNNPRRETWDRADFSYFIFPMFEDDGKGSIIHWGYFDSEFFTGLSYWLSGRYEELSAPFSHGTVILPCRPLCCDLRWLQHASLSCHVVCDNMYGTGGYYVT